MIDLKINYGTSLDTNNNLTTYSQEVIYKDTQYDCGITYTLILKHYPTEEDRLRFFAEQISVLYQQLSSKIIEDITGLDYPSEDYKTFMND